MTPYYDDGQVAIYHGDSREILPTLSRADLILSDPPYGISIVGSSGTVGGTKAGKAREYAPVHGDNEAFDPSWLLPLAQRLILWGANHYAERLPSASKWLVWDKRDGGNSDNFADCELAWTNLGGPARLHRQMWRGMLRSETQMDGVRFHPTQKPVGLMSWCIQVAGIDGLIADPYMGSGSTLRAAKDLGRRCVGIEMEERYCELAANRMCQEVLDFGEVA